MKTSCELVIALGLILAPGLSAGSPPTCGPHSTNPKCVAALPEPSPIPELVLSLTAVAGGFWLLRRKTKAV